jgi:hypothetical protein
MLGILLIGTFGRSEIIMTSRSREVLEHYVRELPRRDADNRPLRYEIVPVE